MSDHEPAPVDGANVQADAQADVAADAPADAVGINVRAGATSSGVAGQSEEVVAATRLLQNLGISVGSGVQPGAVAYDKPMNLGLKLPTFKGEPDRSGRVSQYAVQDFLDRIDAYFSTNAGQYASDSHQLLSLLSCFPFSSPAA